MANDSGSPVSILQGGHVAVVSAAGALKIDGAITASPGGFAIPACDYAALSYTGDNLTAIVFKTGGSGGTTVATLTLAYTGSQLTSVTQT